METALAISDYCLITKNKIYKGGQLVFGHPGSAESFLDKIYSYLEITYPKFHKMDNLCKLGFLAVEILLKDSDHEKKYSNTETGLILTNANASLDVDLKYVKTIDTGASPSLFVYTLSNIVIGEISIRHHFTGENAFFLFKEFNGNFIVEYVMNLFENKLIKNCICGWVDFLKEDYRALLFLVEMNKEENILTFNSDNLNKLNLPDHG